MVYSTSASALDLHDAHAHRILVLFHSASLLGLPCDQIARRSNVVIVFVFNLATAHKKGVLVFRVPTFQNFAGQSHKKKKDACGMET